MKRQGGNRFRLDVLSPGGADPDQDFAEPPNEKGHAPVNFHAYAACTGGRFLRSVSCAVRGGRAVLLLLRGDFRASARALRQLQKAGLRVAVSLKETGMHQIAEQLDHPSRLPRFLEIAHAADGYLAPTPEAADFCRAIRGNEGGVAYLPTPYPLHDARWNLAEPMESRQGILIGTREFDIPSRNHAAALMVARELQAATKERVTVYNLDGRREARMLERLGFPKGTLRIEGESASYRAYLEVMSAHKIVFQLDTSFVPGQVAGDALLCRVPCVGGNGAIEREAFPELCGANRSIAELAAMAERLLRDAEANARAVAQAQQRAVERLSFDGCARELEKFFAR